jgi:hypothetical protein
MRIDRNTGRLAVLLAIAGIAIGAAGCGGSDDGNGGGTPSNAAATSTTDDAMKHEDAMKGEKKSGEAMKGEKSGEAMKDEGK